MESITDTIELLIAIPLLVSIGALLLCGAYNKHLPVWFCHHMGWHLAPKEKGFDGCSLMGKCPRCGKPVLQDSQGNWF